MTSLIFFSCDDTDFHELSSLLSFIIDFFFFLLERRFSSRVYKNRAVLYNHRQKKKSDSIRVVVSRRVMTTICFLSLVDAERERKRVSR